MNARRADDGWRLLGETSQSPPPSTAQRGKTCRRRPLAISSAATASGRSAIPTPAQAAGILRDYCAAYARGFGDFVTDGVQRVSGHAPRR